ncbi:MAG: hypothetical protein RJA58_915 [Pseudomonadota bacterium]|jgi:hypothetical protein
MFESVRRHQRIFLGIVLLLIIPSFVVVGAWDLIAPSSDATTVAKVGRQKIDLNQWERVHQDSLNRLQAQLGGRVDPALFDSDAARKATLNDLVTQQLLMNAVNDYKIRVTDEQIRKTIASIPAAQREGRFNMEQYQQVLKAQGLTAAGFEAQLRSDLSIEVLPAALAGSSLAPRSVARRLAQISLEERTVRFKRIAVSELASGVSVTQEEISSFYQSNQALFQTPEEVDIALVMFSKPGSADMVEQFSNLVYEQSDSLEPAAKKLGLPIVTLQGVRRQGVAPGSSAAKAAPDVLRVLTNARFNAALFSADVLVNKRNTEAVEIAPGVLASGRVIAHRPAAPMPLASVAARIEKELRDRKAADLANQQAQAAGQAGVASITGLSAAKAFARIPNLKEGQKLEIPQDVYQAIFSTELKSLPAVISVPTSPTNPAAWVVVIDSAKVPAADSQAVRDVVGREFQMLERASAQDLLDRWIAARREAVGVTLYPEKLAKSPGR